MLATPLRAGHLARAPWSRAGARGGRRRQAPEADLLAMLEVRGGGGGGGGGGGEVRQLRTTRGDAGGNRAWRATPRPDGEQAHGGGGATNVPGCVA